MITQENDRIQDSLTTVLIADDDEVQLAYMAALVGKLRPDWQIIAQVATVEAIETNLLEKNPSLAILDVKFSGSTSLEMVRSLRDDRPIIFVTGDPQFAAEAFTCEAADFILKPIKVDRLEQALRRVDVLLGYGSASKTARPWATSLRMQKGHDLVWSSLSEVCYFEAQRKYTRVVLKNQEGLLKMGISTVLKHLNPEEFWQIHRGIVINLAHMAAAKRDEFGRLIIVMADRDIRLVVSKTYEHLFREGFS